MDVAFFRYTALGAVGTVVHFAILGALLGLVGPVIASTAGAIGGCIVNFISAQKLVFASSLPVAYSFPRFLVVAISGIAANAAIVAALVVLLPVFAAQAVSTACVLVLGFALNRRWSFNEH